MKLIVVAAGQGTRLRPLTDDRPKCMVPFFGKPIIDHILDTARSCGIEDLAVVHGYRADVLEAHLANRGVTCFHNPRYDSTNMVASLFCAGDWLDGDVIVSYGDIVYREQVLRALLSSESGLAIAIDRQWQQLWDWRMEDPLADAETLKLNGQGQIVELGKKPGSLPEIQGQYMGLIRWQPEATRKIKAFYAAMDRSAIYDGKDFDNMYMTSFLQNIIDRLMPAKAIMVDGGWVEVDSLADLEAYETHRNDLSWVLKPQG